MKRVFATLMLWPLAAVQVHAQSLSANFVSPPEPARPRPSLSLRIVEDALDSSKPVHNSGMIAQTEIMPNGMIGVGLLKASPRKVGPGEFRLDPAAPRSRKAAVSFVLKF